MSENLIWKMHICVCECVCVCECCITSALITFFACFISSSSTFSASRGRRLSTFRIVGAGAGGCSGGLSGLGLGDELWWWWWWWGGFRIGQRLSSKPVRAYQNK